MRDVWERFRAALCLSGGSRRPPPTLSPPPVLVVVGGGGDAGGGGEGQGEDLLSALPDDVLLLVLLRLPSAAAAARTSVLSRRWRGLWARLPELRFPDLADLARPRAALAALAAPALQLLHIVAGDADPADAAAVLRLAAPCLTGELVLHDAPPKVGAIYRDWAEGVDSVVELPCFDKVERIDLRLAFLCIALPLSGVFAKLTVLRLARIQFHGPCDLGDMLSSAQCPALRELRVYNVLWVFKLTIRSDSIISIDLGSVEGLQKLTIVAPMLRELSVFSCFMTNRRGKAVADISAPVLEMLMWSDFYDMRSVQLGELPQLQILRIYCVENSGFPYYPCNWDPVMLLRHFQKIPILNLVVTSPTHVMDPQYLVKVITLLPDIEELHLSLDFLTIRHAFGPFVFHLLRMFSGIRKLELKITEEIKARTVCSPGCFCHQPQNWKTEELYLNSLQEVKICHLTGSERELTFLKLLLKWTSRLKTITLVIHPSVTVSDQICQLLLGHYSRPEICMKIYLYRNGSKVMYEPVG